MISTCFTNFFLLGVKFSGIVDLEQGKLLEYYPTWGPKFNIEMDVTITALPSSNPVWMSLIHFTKNFNDDSYGDRVPAIWLHKSGFLAICSAISGNKSKCTITTQAVGQKFNLRIRQNGKSRFKVLVNGNVIFNVFNSQPMSFANVKAYGGDPWADVLKPEFGIVENLKLCNNG